MHITTVFKLARKSASCLKPNQNERKETVDLPPVLIFPSLFGCFLMYLKFCDSYFDTSWTVYVSTHFSLVIPRSVILQSWRNRSNHRSAYRIPTGYHSSGVKNVRRKMTNYLLSPCHGMMNVSLHNTKKIVVPEKIFGHYGGLLFSSVLWSDASMTVYLFKCRLVMACHSLTTKVTNK